MYLVIKYIRVIQTFYIRNNKIRAMPDTFIKNNMSIVLSFLVAVFTAGGVFAEFTAIKNELTTVHERLDKKIKVINNLEDRILDMEKQLEYERGFLEAAAKKKR